MNHDWIAISYNKNHAVGWICQNCGQYEQLEPEIRRATRFCGAWIFVSRTDIFMRNSLTRHGGCAKMESLGEGKACHNE